MQDPAPGLSNDPATWPRGARWFTTRNPDTGQTLRFAVWCASKDNGLDYVSQTTEVIFGRAFTLNIVSTDGLARLDELMAREISKQTGLDVQPA